MTDTTETLWDVDGTSLQTYAFNIVTLGGSRMSPPPVRGDDITIPFRPGQVFTPKTPDAQTITLGMWVSGANEDGTIPTDPGPRMFFMQNWRKLRKLLFTPRRQFVLTKRFWIPEEELEGSNMALDDLPTQSGYRLITASAMGSYAGGLEPQMTGPGRATFTVDIKLTTPYFFSAPININLTNLAPSDTVNIVGDDRTMAIGVEFTGPLTAPQITNGDVWFRYDTGISLGVKVLLDVLDFQATHNYLNEEDSYKSAGYVVHDGDPFWLYLEPGENVIVLSSSEGTGSARLTYQPGWF